MLSCTCCKHFLTASTEEALSTDFARILRCSWGQVWLCNSLHVCSCACGLASSSWGFPLPSQPHGQRALWGPGELPCSLVPVTAGGEADVLQEVGQTPPLPVEMLVALLSECGLPALPCCPVLGANSPDPNRSSLGCAVVSCFPLQPVLL